MTQCLLYNRAAVNMWDDKRGGGAVVDDVMLYGSALRWRRLAYHADSGASDNYVPITG